MFFRRKAFSLIELSIVILVIGILITGLLQGSALLRKTRLATARAITNSSPVLGIKNLVVWYETSLEDSVAIDSDNKLIRWKDQNAQVITKVDAYDGDRSISPPDYVEDGINGIPTIRFNGVDQSIDIDPDGNGLNAIVRSSYTIFVVEADRNSSGTLYNHFLTGGDFSGQVNTNLHVGIRYATAPVAIHKVMRISFDQGANTVWSSRINEPPQETTLLHSFVHGGPDGFSHWLNRLKDMGSPLLRITGSDSDEFNDLVSYSSPSLGASSFGIYDAFEGDISEFIVYNRALSDKEREHVEDYLVQKYNITTEITLKK